MSNGLGFELTRLDESEATFTLTAPGQTAALTVLRAYDPITPLTEACLDMLAADTGEPIGLIWQGREWQYRWVFTTVGADTVAIGIERCADARDFGRCRGERQAIFEATLDRRRWLTGIEGLLCSLLRAGGFAGYVDVWRGAEFPVGRAAKLRRMLRRPGQLSCE